MGSEVVNILTVIGSPSKVKEVLDLITTDEFNVSFSEFIPMPKNIIETASPLWLMEECDYIDWKLDNPIVDLYRGSPITEDIRSELLEEYGVDTWSDWAMKFWGTKTDILETIGLGKPNKIKFITADLTPYNAMVTLSKLFPRVRLKVEYADEDLGVNVGIYYLLGGEIVTSEEPKPLSNEAYSLSMEITGDKYYITLFLEELKESEADEEFPIMCLEIAYDCRSITDKFPTFILKQFEKWAVRDEDYEFASELIKIIKDE